MRSYYKPSNYTMKNSVGYLMRMSINRILPKMEALFEDEELTFSQWTTLVALHSGITTAGDLARNICHDAGSLTRLIDQMVKRGLVTRDGGMDCSVSMFDYALRRENQCRTDPKSYGRLNLACRFPANKASVGATMVAQGYAVDYRMFSGGAYVDLMQKAAARRAGLWGVDYEAMRQLAVRRAQVPQGCNVGTIKR